MEAGIPLDRIAYHFHDTRGTALANVAAGLDAGVRCFDAATGGTGGCPYAPGAAGNLATEDLVYFLDASGWAAGVSLARRAGGRAVHHLGARTAAGHEGRTGGRLGPLDRSGDAMALTRAERMDEGRALRTTVPRSQHAEWTPRRDRDPIGILQASNETRVPELIPYRFGRMAISPFAFYRGSAAVMAADLAETPATGLRVQACGDAHVSNFGEFATPERRLVFDINDFDETLPGAWEWDVKRLAASIDLVARDGTADPDARREIVSLVVREYRERLRAFAELSTLDLWHASISVEDVLEHFPKGYRPRVARHLSRARRKTHRRAVAKLTEVVHGHRRFIESPPLIVRLHRTEFDLDDALGLLDGYRKSLPDDRRHVLDQFEMVDIARKTVGVGSVGTRCWVALFEGPELREDDWIVLQVKEAGPSVLEPYMGESALPHHGLRVVTGQRLTQSASDGFLGWSEGPTTGRHYYVRQLWDAKGSGDPTLMDPVGLAHYGALCAWALARAHARTGDAVTIAAYLGKSRAFDDAIAEFAARYADQAEVDHAELVDAIAAGRVPAEMEIES